MKKLTWVLLLTWILLSSVYSAEPNFVIVGSEAKTQVVSPKALYPLGGANWHTHTCKKCGTIWGHTDRNPNAIHTCPKCNRLEYVQNPRNGTTTKKVIWQ